MTNSSQPLPHAGVRFPPPLVFLIALALAFALNKFVPLWIERPEPHWMWDVGRLLLLAGVLCSGWGMVTFRRNKTAVSKFRPATKIVTNGPYRFTRNPMYVGLTIVYIGAALILDTWWAIALLPVVVAIIDRTVIAREERYLTSAFGADYAAYRSRVRRWL